MKSQYIVFRLNGKEVYSTRLESWHDNKEITKLRKSVASGERVNPAEIKVSIESITH